MNLPPLVSISCLTFNHVDYIRKCLDGFMMQDCNFDFEVLIHDDASTDATAEIIKEYQLMYPNIIKPIIQIENQWSKGIRDITLKYNISRAKGKYIAFCEGDDYWTDPLKLQKQVDFLEANHEFVMCFHDCRFMRLGMLQETFLQKHNFKINREISKAEFNKYWLAQTATIVLRNNHKIFEEMNLMPSIFYGDMVFRFVLLKFGKIYLINDVMSVYRINSGGVTQSVAYDNTDFSKIEQYKNMQKFLKMPTSKLVSKSYYSIAKRRYVKNQYLSFIKYFLLAFISNPSYLIQNSIKDINKK